MKNYSCTWLFQAISTIMITALFTVKTIKGQSTDRPTNSPVPVMSMEKANELKQALKASSNYHGHPNIHQFLNTTRLRLPETKIHSHTKIHPDDVFAFIYAVAGSMSRYEELMQNKPSATVLPEVYTDQYQKEKVRYSDYKSTNIETLLKNIAFRKEDDISTQMAKAILYSGCLKLIKNLHHYRLQAPLLDAAEIYNGKRSITFGETTATLPQNTEEWDKLPNGATYWYHHKLQESLKHLMLHALDGGCLLSVNDTSTLSRSLHAHCGQGKDLSPVLGLIKATAKAGANQLTQEIFNRLINNFNHMSKDQQDQILISACKITHCEAIKDILLARIASIQNAQTEKLEKVNSLSRTLSGLHCSADGNKKRTPIHYILRNADGSQEKSIALASRQNTVRALLMLIAAGADPYSYEDIFPSKNGTPVKGCLAGYIPGRSRCYLEQGLTNPQGLPKKQPSATKKGASFRFFNKKDIMGGETSHSGWCANPIWQTNFELAEAIRSNLLDMCDLCAYVMGKDNKNSGQRQQDRIKQHLLEENSFLVPKEESYMKEYLEQLTKMLKKISVHNNKYSVKKLLQFKTNAADEDEDISWVKDSVDRCLKNTGKTKRCVEHQQKTPPQ